MSVRILLLGALFSCATEHESAEADPVLPPDVMVSTPVVEDIRCPGAPAAGASTGWRHTASRFIVELGDPRHRGIDLIATPHDATHTISGKLTYGTIEKDLEDEDVELFACIDARWQPLGAARTDGDGRFALTLTGDERLPAGMRDLYVSVRGDRTGAAFIGFVAPKGSPIVVSDVDGTLTGSENAYPLSLALGGDVPAHATAPETLMSAAAHGVSVIYISARGDRFTHDTRTWLAAKGFPRGPVRLPTSIITMPGEDTIDFKSNALASLAAFKMLAGFGNRGTDIAAYTEAGLTPNRIFIKLPEFTDEVAGELMAGNATGFDLYDRVRTDNLPVLMPTP